MSQFAGSLGAFSSRSYVTSAANAGIAMAARLIDANAASLPVVNMHILPWVSFHILANSSNFWSRSCGRSGRENPLPGTPAGSRPQLAGPHDGSGADDSGRPAFAPAWKRHPPRTMHRPGMANRDDPSWIGILAPTLKPPPHWTTDATLRDKANTVH